MGINNAKGGKLLYHLTNVDNLDSILEHGLLPRKYILENKIKFDDIADPNIIIKRQEKELDSYVPFHFHPYTAFDFAVKHKVSDSTKLIYICIKRKFAKDHGFSILPQHPLSGDSCKLYSYDDGFEMIDWNTMMEKGKIDNYAKEVKMAECLTKKIEIGGSYCVFYVASEEMKSFVEARMKAHHISFNPPYVNIKAEWFSC